ncbi:MAG TPA: two-component regulator propeller domain-containing protein, partial [Chitinophagaceae bacterium]
MLSAFIRKFLLITTTLLTALDLALLAQQVNIRRYSIEDGLVNNDVLNIYQDQQGFIWLCTRGGLSRYDGSRFTNYTTASGLDQDMINDIIEVAPQEFIIAQNSDGPCLLKNGRITPILPKTKITLNGFYLAANSRLVATTDLNGMAEWDKRNIRRLDSSTRSIAIMTVINDSVWLLYDPAAGIQLTNSSFKSLSPITPVFATTLFTDSQNQTWIGTTTGLRLLNPTIQQGQPPALLPLPASFDLPVLRQGYIYDFMEDSRGNYWIATGAGLLKIDTGGNSQLYTEKDGWSQEHINCMKEDDQHNIWIGSTTGLLRFSTNPEIKKIVTGFGKLYDGIAGISPVGTNKVRLFGIKHTGELDLQTGELDNLQNHSSASVLYKLNSRETLLVNGEKGTIYQVGKKEVETIRWPLKYFSDVVKIDPGLFLCALDKDLFLVSNGHYTKILTIATGSQVNKMAIDKRNFLWVGTWSNGLFKMKISNGPGSLQLKIIDTIASRLPDRYIRAIYTDKENELWIGTRNKGVIRLLEHTNGDCEVQHYGTGEGLSSNFVIVINRDSSGNIWAGSKQGLDKLIPAGNRYRVFNFGWLKKFHADVGKIRSYFI